MTTLMQVAYRYQGKSTVTAAGSARQVRFAPNLARDVVSFDGVLRHPLRFREAISAMHDVVIADLKYQPRDKTAYLEWKAQEKKREAALRRATYQAEVARHAATHGEVSPELKREHAACAREYWKARNRFEWQVRRENLSVWQRLFPLDPVVTVADDVVFFELFSRDESSYACLTCGRDDCFDATDNIALGTTNIDYSWDLYDHFQTLRSYRQTRLTVDPAGVTAETADSGLRMEKIDLPNSWLSGFLQVQAAMTLANVRVELSTDAVYSLLAWLRRHRANTSPRAIRFELEPGKPARIVLEPWEQVIESHGAPYSGELQTIRIWGRRRLLTLARLLPLLQSVDVHLLGTGLPSFWVAKLGEMRLTLGLSGWTANDWTSGSELDALMPPGELEAEFANQMAANLQERRAAKLKELSPNGDSNPRSLAALMQLARSGQAICDLDAGVYRWRQILPAAVDWHRLEEDRPERAGAREILARNQVEFANRESTDFGEQITGRSGGRNVELRLNPDSRMIGGNCNCSHHFRNGLRMGPCRHLLAMHLANTKQERTASLFERLVGKKR